jgi:parallel beta-helix repeat protein
LSEREKSWVAIVDRDFLPDRLGKKRDLSSKVLVFTVGLIAVLIIGAIAGLTGQIGKSGDLPPPETHVKYPARITYTAHNPILIIGDIGFTGPNATTGIVWGSGTEADPYIVEGWDINASSANGIEIRDSSVPFIIRDCHVHDSLEPSSRSAIRLYNCINGILENNNCSTNNFEGISIYYSSNNSLNNNDCSNICAGIFLVSSSNNSMNRNTCSNNQDGGILLAGSNNNSISNSTCLNSSIGIWLGASDDNNCLCNNNCSDSSVGIEVDRSGNNILNNNTCTNNGEGIQIAYSNNNTIVNNHCSSNTNSGVYLFLSGNNTLLNNICSNNGDVGVKLDLSAGNTVANNNCSFNALYGLTIENVVSANNIIWNNTFHRNNGAGDAYDPAHVQAYDDGTDNRWNSSDGSGNYWSDWTTPDVAPPDGTVDMPYNISGSAEAKDNFPLTAAPTEPIPEFGAMPLVVIVLLTAAFFTTGARRRRTR